MNLTISGHHLEVTPALREYVMTKLERVTRHFDQVVDITVLLSVEKQKEKERRQKAEVTLHVKGKDIFADSSDADLYAAIDKLVDKLGFPCTNTLMGLGGVPGYCLTTTFTVQLRVEPSQVPVTTAL